MSLKEAVERLYCFRDEYFENHSSDTADKKIEDLTAELNKTLKIIDEQSGDLDEAGYNFLKAKALNVQSEFNSEALNILTKLVKFHPKFADAWNELGICFWKKNDIKAAKSCFENALKECNNPESLRNLSMTLRQMGQTPEEKLHKTHESLEKAKEAVSLNIQDGKSWYVLGNAYLSLYFITDQNPSLLKQCLSSYNQAFSDESTRCSPDLYFNWAVALKYDENYRLALEYLDKALKYDPLWSEPKELLTSLVNHLENVQLMIAKKGKLKPRKIKELVTSLQTELKTCESETHIDKAGKSVTLQRSKFSELSVGRNDDKFLKGKVVCHVYFTDSPSFTFCMIDEDENCFSVNVYNMVQSKGVIIGDCVTVYQPLLQNFDFTYKEKAFSFPSIRVNSPLQLAVNKKRLGKDMLATPKLSVTLKSE